ncbi:MAG TPA: lysophospholipid acyltransferase family protein [Candidatus Eisenbacteria bacterium]|nr:lysophospholipid acyltransferase family protein [Candidatus Eisenbacteria bacterium]
MRWIKLAALASLWPVFFVLVALVHLWVTVLRLPNRWKIISRLMRAFTFLVRTILNIKLRVTGAEGLAEPAGLVIISNHMSYVDGIVLGSLFPVVFVSKKEVKRWPVVGQWNRLCGTIFIDRRRKQKVSLLVAEMAAKLRQEANVLLFPEGTSTDGETMLPFQTAPLAGPLRARATILPVALAYRSVNDLPVTAANRDLIYWYGEMDFLRHFWSLLALKSIEVLVTIQPRIECARYPDTSAGRKQLAADCYQAVLGTRGLPVSEAAEPRPDSSTLLSS